MAITVAYQGVPHSFSYAAAMTYFGKNKNSGSALDYKEIRYVGTTAFKEIVEKIQIGQADFGLLPIENTLAGSVYVNYDLLENLNLAIIGEVTIPIAHFLHGTEGATLDTITTVCSHPKALEQCVNFINRTSHHHNQKMSATRWPYLQRTTDSTSHAAQLVAETRDISLGAIASEEAGREFGLIPLAQNIEDHKENFTRFLVIGKQPNEEKEEYRKCSIAFTLPHQPGALAKTLDALASCKANLTKIESRPLHGSIFEYRFYVDFISNTFPRPEIESLAFTTQSLSVFGWYREAYYSVTRIGNSRD